eukprot:gnl/MRDRNA2_/MRDRNA2_30995_c0_seq1.p1 gnl/MRDRNA2_/MRDRNA2_30995_c0~~gnl/MRDRNA2_/MRDRNA2_30995_c0_seq1.p1  ORF type:complete len:586 (-),score=72.36 gnl/MRDRNA2_/MRDRNA2_30995_c0_seq1:340-2097(-)
MPSYALAERSRSSRGAIVRGTVNRAKALPLLFLSLSSAGALNSHYFSRIPGVATSSLSSLGRHNYFARHVPVVITRDHDDRMDGEGSHQQMLHDKGHTTVSAPGPSTRAYAPAYFPHNSQAHANGFSKTPIQEMSKSQEQAQVIGQALARVLGQIIAKAQVHVQAQAQGHDQRALSPQAQVPVYPPADITGLGSEFSTTSRTEKIILRRRKKAKHDDVVIRSRESAIPQVQRYTGSDWAGILFKTPTSEVLQRIRGPVAANICWAALVWALHNCLGLKFHSFAQIHGLVGGALGLLLVFRTNSAYERFWEGRKIWEQVLDNARSLARMCILYRDEMSMRKVTRIANLICAFSSLLAEHLGAQCRNYYSQIITRRDLLELNRVGNRPLHISNMICQEIRSIPDQAKGDQVLFSSRERIAMLKYVDKMTRSIGECERLVQTPVPLNYARHTSRFLSLWCLTLPLALVGDAGATIIPIMTLVSWGLFGIQEIGLMIEEPFRRALDLDVIIRTIYADVLETTQFQGWWTRSNEAKKQNETTAVEAGAKLGKAGTATIAEAGQIPAAGLGDHPRGLHPSPNAELAFPAST